MGNRLELQSVLEGLIGSKNVFFQPPETVKLMYPCIVYKRGFGKTKFANDNPYNHKVGYILTIMDPDPDSDIPKKIAQMPMCTFERHYTKDNLNHDIYNLYF
jgi:hypothetical protein